jgi:hypothetical protein
MSFSASNVGTDTEAKLRVDTNGWRNRLGRIRSNVVVRDDDVGVIRLDSRFEASHVREEDVEKAATIDDNSDRGSSLDLVATNITNNDMIWKVGTLLLHTLLL